MGCHQETKTKTHEMQLLDFSSLTSVWLSGLSEILIEETILFTHVWSETVSCHFKPFSEETKHLLLIPDLCENVSALCILRWIKVIKEKLSLPLYR